jgi:hypothetical protein
MPKSVKKVVIGPGRNAHHPPSRTIIQTVIGKANADPERKPPILTAGATWAKTGKVKRVKSAARTSFDRIRFLLVIADLLPRGRSWLAVYNGPLQIQCKEIAKT